MKTYQQYQLPYPCQSGLCSLLLTLLVSLPISLLAQTNLAFEDDFSRPHLWEEIYLIPLNTSTGQLLDSDGDIHIEGGEVVFDDCADQSDKRVYRKVGSPLGQYWTLDVDFTPTAGGPHGVAHIIAGLTAGTANPYNIVPETVSSSSPTYAHTEQDGIFLEYISPLYGATSDYYLRVRSKDGTSYHTPVSCGYILPNGQTYYLRLYMANGSLTFQRFNDAARTNLEDDYALSVPSGVTGLNVLQHSNIPQGSYDRKLTATIDNVKLYDSSMPCLRCDDYNLFTTTGQTENYVLSKIARIPASSASVLDAMNNAADAWVEVAYVDGLGRPLQEVSVGAAPDCQGDLVQYHQYDAFGRESLVDLPYVASGINGSFRNDGSGGLPIGDQRDFYDPPSPTPANFPHIPTTDLAVPFAEMLFEASPLNRVVEQGAPGADWQVGSGHSIRSSFRPNTTADDVFFFSINPQPGSTYSTKYAPGELMRQEVMDENDVRTWTYTDKLGRTILIQKEISGADIRTYYLYDEWGRVKYVLQPQGVEEFQANSTNGYGNAYVLSEALIDDYTFQYIYDARGRVIEKRVPGADWVHLVYNKLDQVILSQDGNQRNNDQWSFIKYDVHARPIITGLFSSTKDRPGLQSDLDGWFNSNFYQLYEVRQSGSESMHGYSDRESYPELWWGTVDVHSVTWYDDYDFDYDGIADISYQSDNENFPDHAVSDQTRGMVTGVKVWILNPDSDMPASLLTTTFYDKYGREIQTLADNHLNGSDITWYEYDFAGQLLFSKHEHIGHDGTSTYGAYERSATVYKSFTYGPRGRLIRTEQKTEDPENVGHETDFVTLSKQRYDKLGQMRQKHLHYKLGDNFLQINEYEYNIRGWLTQINDPFAGGVPAGSYEDLFSLKLTYNGGYLPQYNGNIANMGWHTPDMGGGYALYDFTYDENNRLTDANYEAADAQGGGPIDVDRYAVTGITYDKNGNIKSLTREGKTGTSSFGTMDDLTYSYAGNQLIEVDDAASVPYLSGVEQFVDGYTTGNDYTYDANGNMTRDRNKGLLSAITYNHLNKPTSVPVGSAGLLYIYAADGSKLRQSIEDYSTSSMTKTTDYVGPFHYEDLDGDGSAAKKMLFFSHEEGRARLDNGQPIYEMFLRDHLGNNRVMFVDDNEDGWVDPATELIQEDHFYPFGLRISGISSVGSPPVPNNYTYTGKEIQDEFGIEWIDFGARMYDASLGSFGQVDPHAENYLAWSSYNYVGNNPIIRVDPDGKDWEISFGKDSDGNTVVLFTFTAAVLNSSEYAVYDQENLILQMTSQLESTFKGNHDGVVFQTKATLRFIEDKSELKANEHLFEFVNDKKDGNESSELKGPEHYGNAEIGGKHIFLNGRIIQDITDGIDVVTTSHEAGHTAGLWHPDTNPERGRMMIDKFHGIDAIPMNQYIPPENKEERKYNLMTSYGQQAKLWGEKNYRSVPRSATEIQLKTIQDLIDCIFCIDGINQNNIK